VSYPAVPPFLAPTRARFIHVTFTWSGLPKAVELEEPVFNIAIDWIRYLPNCWILYTTTGADWWYERIRHYMTKADRVFICELNLQDKAGWLDKWVWTWLNKPR
jgi:hypothetical protein